MWMQVPKCTFCDHSCVIVAQVKFLSAYITILCFQYTVYRRFSCMYSFLYILVSNVDNEWTCTGTFAVVSLMTGTVVEQLVPIPSGLNCSSPEAAEFEDQRIGVASAIAFLSGVMMVRKDQIYLTIIPTWGMCVKKRINFIKFLCFVVAKLHCVMECLYHLFLWLFVSSFVCLVCSWASSPHTYQSPLLRHSPALPHFTWLFHSCRTCWDYGLLATRAPFPCSRFVRGNEACWDIRILIISLSVMVGCGVKY